MFYQKYFPNKHFKLNERWVKLIFFSLHVQYCAVWFMCVCGVMTVIRRPVELFHLSVSVLRQLTKALALQTTANKLPQFSPRGGQ